MPRYKVIIEFNTDEALTFPEDAQLLDAMGVQLESLSDGTISRFTEATIIDSKIVGQVDMNVEDDDL